MTVPAVAASAAGLDAAPHAAQIADLLAAIDEGREPLVTAADARTTLELVCAVYQSAREGRPVISADLDEQLAVLATHSIAHLKALLADFPVRWR